MSTLYEIAESQFDALASGHGGQSAVHALRRAQVTKHSVMVRAMRQLAADVTPDSVPALDLACRILASARELDAESADSVLGHPAVGAWLAACLRRLVGVDDGPHPLCTEVEQLGAVAAAAAIRAGMAFELAVRCQQDGVFLPGFGMARFADGGPTDPATIRYDGARASIEVAGRTVTVPDAPACDGDGWIGLRRLTCDTGGVGVEVELDDLDPRRIGHGETVAPRQSDSEFAAWQRLFTDAWQLLVRDHPERARELSTGLVAVVPLLGGEGGSSMAITARDAFGSLCATPGGSGVNFADTLIHEFQHSKLYALADIVPLHSANREPKHYSPWREDPRPLEGLLHGAYSYVGVTGYWDVQRRLRDRDARRDNAEFEFHRWSRQVAATVDTLLGSGDLTEAGVRFVRGMGAAVGSWQAAPDSPRTRHLANLANADHQIRWRLRNRRPDPETVRELADAWQSGTDCPHDLRQVPATVLPGARRQTMSDRLWLIQYGLLQPVGFEEVCEDAARLAEIGNRTLGAADVALLRGDRDEAYEGYRSRIAGTPDDLEAWVGLALSRHTADFLAADAPVWSEPEVLRAVHLELRGAMGEAPDAGELAAWLAPAYESA